MITCPKSLISWDNLIAIAKEFSNKKLVEADTMNKIANELHTELISHISWKRRARSSQPQNSGIIIAEIKPNSEAGKHKCAIDQAMKTTKKLYSRISSSDRVGEARLKWPQHNQ